MGTGTALSNTLFGRTRGAVLSVLYGNVGEAFYLRQLARRTAIALGPVQREVRQLVDAGLVTRKIVGAQTLYSANQESPVFPEIILNREINPTVYSIKEFTGKVRGNFLKTVLGDKKLFIIGDENVLRELGQK